MKQLFIEQFERFVRKIRNSLHINLASRFTVELKIKWKKARNCFITMLRNRVILCSGKKKKSVTFRRYGINQWQWRGTSQISINLITARSSNKEYLAGAITMILDLRERESSRARAYSLSLFLSLLLSIPSVPIQFINSFNFIPSARRNKFRFNVNRTL